MQIDRTFFRRFSLLPTDSFHASDHGLEILVRNCVTFVLDVCLRARGACHVPCPSVRGCLCLLTTIPWWLFGLHLFRSSNPIVLLLSFGLDISFAQCNGRRRDLHATLCTTVDICNNVSDASFYSMFT